MRDAFKKCYDEIHADDALKERVKAQMRLAAAEPVQEKETAKAGQKRRYLRWGTGAGLVAAASLALFFWRNPGNGSIYVTPIEDGQYYESVELKNGTLHFVEETVKETQTISMGRDLGAVQRPDVQKNGENENGQETRESEGSTQAADGTSKEEPQTQAKSGMTDGAGETSVMVETVTEGVPMPENEDDYSTVDGVPVYVTVRETAQGRQYEAVFEQNGAYIRVSGDGISQKKFIDALYREIKKR